jgi:hypothetical protein
MCGVTNRLRDLGLVVGEITMTFLCKDTKANGQDEPVIVCVRDRGAASGEMRFRCSATRCVIGVEVASDPAATLDEALASMEWHKLDMPKPLGRRLILLEDDED